MSTQNTSSVTGTFAVQVEYRTHSQIGTPYAMLVAFDTSRDNDKRKAVVLQCHCESMLAFTRKYGEYAAMIVSDFVAGKEYETDTTFAYDTYKPEKGESHRMLVIGDWKGGAAKAARLAYAMSQAGWVANLEDVATYAERKRLETAQPAPKAAPTRQVPKASKAAKAPKAEPAPVTPAAQPALSSDPNTLKLQLQLLKMLAKYQTAKV